MKPSSLFVCHCLFFAWYAFLVFSVKNLRGGGGGGGETPPGVVVFGGPWKFLTVLNLVFQAFFYGISLVADMFVLMKKQRTAKSTFPFRDLLFGGLAFPVSTFVFISFWTLYLYDRQLVYPKSLDGIIPHWLNHAMHTVIFPTTLMDLLITPRRYPSKGKGLGLLLITGAAYICWILWIHSVTGTWVYPLFEFLNPPTMAVFFFVCGIILIFIYNAGEFICRMIWGDSIVITEIYQKKGK